MQYPAYETWVEIRTAFQELVKDQRSGFRPPPEPREWEWESLAEQERSSRWAQLLHWAWQEGLLAVPALAGKYDLYRGSLASGDMHTPGWATILSVSRYARHNSHKICWGSTNYDIFRQMRRELEEAHIGMTHFSEDIEKTIEDPEENIASFAKALEAHHKELHRNKKGMLLGAWYQDIVEMGEFISDLQRIHEARIDGREGDPFRYSTDAVTTVNIQQTLPLPAFCQKMLRNVGGDIGAKVLEEKDEVRWDERKTAWLGRLVYLANKDWQEHEYECCRIFKSVADEYNRTHAEA